VRIWSGEINVAVLDIESGESLTQLSGHPMIGSMFGSNLPFKNHAKLNLSDTESMELFLVRDQEAGGSNPLAPTISLTIELVLQAFDSHVAASARSIWFEAKEIAPSTRLWRVGWLIVMNGYGFSSEGGTIPGVRQRLSRPGLPRPTRDHARGEVGERARTGRKYSHEPQDW
jgi:hypothetical protein